MLKAGLLVDNCQKNEGVAESSFRKLAAMRARAVGVLWTGGTRHKRNVYERCERELDNPFYLCRVGGHRQTPAEWIDWATAALREVPEQARSRVVFTAGNEPERESWRGDPAGYAAFCDALVEQEPAARIAYACPALVDDWQGWLRAAKPKHAPKWIVVNAYADGVRLVPLVAALFPGAKIVIGEINSRADQRGAERIAYHQWAFRKLEAMGAYVAIGFIAGGKSDGAWDERYVYTDEEAAGCAWTPQEVKVTLSEQHPQIFAEWTKADGIENNFKKHLLGTGVIKPSAADLKFLADEVQASVSQLKGALANYPF